MKQVECRSRGRPRILDREKCLETALELFWRYGYEGTSISDLTKAMGVNPPSLYAAFGSKQELYLETVDAYGRTHGDFAMRAFAEEPTAKAAMGRTLAEAAELFVAGPSPRGCMLSVAVVSCGPEHGDVAAALARKRSAVTAAFKARFDGAIVDEELPVNTDSEALAAFYSAVIQGLSIQARDGAGLETLRRIAAMALEAWPK
ncbi:MAG: TetR/AcrR family transcriptional regulator [Rhodospirillaceae bacterium]|nr:TetR/AcrR family transcriptional regulator [Rhodospirillales bacterium]